MTKSILISTSKRRSPVITVELLIEFEKLIKCFRKHSIKVAKFA